MIRTMGPLAPKPVDTSEARLRQAAQQMEGVFLAQLLQAMRDTVPSDGLLSPGSGEQMFTSMLDERVAQTAASRQEHGLGAVLFRQLRAALNPPAVSEGAP